MVERVEPSCIRMSELLVRLVELLRGGVKGGLKGGLTVSGDLGVQLCWGLSMGWAELDLTRPWRMNEMLIF